VAFPLTFMDETGRATTYRWVGYPNRVTVVDPKEPPVLWSSVIEDPARPRDTAFLTITVYCGPQAPYPLPPTADEFQKAVWSWLYR
jgi:hypothetical protein